MGSCKFGHRVNPLNCAIHTDGGQEKRDSDARLFFTPKSVHN